MKKCAVILFRAIKIFDMRDYHKVLRRSVEGPVASILNQWGVIVPLDNGLSLFKIVIVPLLGCSLVFKGSVLNIKYILITK